MDWWGEKWHWWWRSGEVGWRWCMVLVQGGGVVVVGGVDGLLLLLLAHTPPYPLRLSLVNNQWFARLVLSPAVAGWW